MSKTMLPPTATPLAVALDLIEERITQLNVGVITKDPTQVPESLLAHLAWEVSVDDWDESWPEDLKRDVIAASEDLHRYKGTPYAVRRALEVFGYRYELVEWWQSQPEGTPGTYRVVVYPYEPTTRVDVDFDTASMRRLGQLLRGVTPVSRVFEIAMGVDVEGTLYSGAVIEQRIRAEIYPAVPKAPVADFELSLAALVAFNTRIEVL